MCSGPCRLHNGKVPRLQFFLDCFVVIPVNCPDWDAFGLFMIPVVVVGALTIGCGWYLHDRKKKAQKDAQDKTDLETDAHASASSA